MISKSYIKEPSTEEEARNLQVQVNIYQQEEKVPHNDTIMMFRSQQDSYFQSSDIKDVDTPIYSAFADAILSDDFVVICKADISWSQLKLEANGDIMPLVQLTANRENQFLFSRIPPTQPKLSISLILASGVTIPYAGKSSLESSKRIIILRMEHKKVSQFQRIRLIEEDFLHIIDIFKEKALRVFTKIGLKCKLKHILDSVHSSILHSILQCLQRREQNNNFEHRVYAACLLSLLSESYENINVALFEEEIFKFFTPFEPEDLLEKLTHILQKKEVDSLFWKGLALTCQRVVAKHHLKILKFSQWTGMIDVSSLQYSRSVLEYATTLVVNYEVPQRIRDTLFKILIDRPTVTRAQAESAYYAFKPSLNCLNNISN